MYYNLFNDWELYFCLIDENMGTEVHPYFIVADSGLWMHVVQQNGTCGPVWDLG